MKYTLCLGIRLQSGHLINFGREEEFMSWTLRVSLLGFVVCILAGCVEQTSQQTHTDQDIFGKMTLDEISNDYTSKVRAYSKRYRAAPTKAEKLEVFKTIPNVTAYQPRLVELINEDPGSAAGLEVVDWWYRRGGRRNSADVITRLIVENYSRVE